MRLDTAALPHTSSPASWWIVATIGFGSVALLGLFAAALGTLRRLRNRLFWELGCYVLLTLGILTRQLLGPGRANGAVVANLTLSLVMALVAFPYAMRRMNKFRPRPGLEHVAFPFGLGYFLNLTSLLAVTWVPTLTK